LSNQATDNELQEETLSKVINPLRNPLSSSHAVTRERDHLEMSKLQSF
jgi:hypothetical protein